jgi:alpha/beta superfamily hydrolase
MRKLIPSPAGHLEAILMEPKVFLRQWAAVLCHPHPQFGGTMHTKAIFRSAQAFQSLGMATLQFNFRGVGRSPGQYDEGRGEKEDVLAAVDFIHARYPNLKLALLGFSFGAWVALQAGSEDVRIDQLIGLGVPLRISSFSFLQSCHKPKLIVQGTLDEFGSREAMESWFETLSEPKQLAWVDGATHLFEGKIPELQQAIIEYFRDRYGLVAVHSP